MKRFQKVLSTILLTILTTSASYLPFRTTSGEHLGRVSAISSDQWASETRNPVHNVQFVKYDVTVSFMAQVLDTVTYLVPQLLDTAS